MARRVYISCDYPERDLPDVQEVCGFLQQYGCVLTFAPEPGWSFYALIEDAIERCDAFLVVAAGGYEASSWLNHEADYAYKLAQWRMGRRVPRLCGRRIEGFVLNPFLRSLPIEWLASDQYERLLGDLPSILP